MWTTTYQACYYTEPSNQANQVATRGSVTMITRHFHGFFVFIKRLIHLLSNTCADLVLPAVSLQATLIINPAVGCQYFPIGLQLPCQLHSITDLWTVSNYTAWKDFRKVATRKWNGWDTKQWMTSQQHSCRKHYTSKPPTAVQNSTTRLTLEKLRPRRLLTSVL